MNNTRSTWLLAALLGMVSPGSPGQEADGPRTRRDAAASFSEDGLARVDVKGLDVVYARTDATLGIYQRVLLRPISIAFQRSWGKPGGPGGTGRVSAEDMQKIRDGLAALLREEVLKELAAGGYAITGTAAHDVLEVDVAIRDLAIARPDVNQPWRGEVHAFSAGEMTLVAELRDSVSGESLVRVYDHDIATDSGFMHRITLGENAAEARKMAAAWAQALRRGLDLSRGIGP